MWLQTHVHVDRIIIIYMAAYRNLVYLRFHVKKLCKINYLVWNFLVGSFAWSNNNWHGVNCASPIFSWYFSMSLTKFPAPYVSANRNGPEIESHFKINYQSMNSTENRLQSNFISVLSVVEIEVSYKLKSNLEIKNTMSFTTKN